MPYIIGYFLIFVLLLIPIAMLSFLVGLYMLTVTTKQKTRVAALTGLFRIPILMWGYIWGVGAVGQLVEFLPISPLLWLAIVFLPLISFAGAALIAEKIAERAEDKIINGQTVTGELIQAVVIWVFSILILVPFFFFHAPNQ